MQQIKCPHCGELFTIDESNYESIVKQIRDHSFEEELNKREKQLAEKYKADLQLELTKKQHDLDNSLNDANKSNEQLRSEIEILKTRLANAESDKVNAVNNNSLVKDKEKSEALAAATLKIQQLENEKQTLKVQYENKLASQKQQAESNVKLLEGKLANADTEKTLAVSKAVNSANSTIEALKTGYEEKLAGKDNELKLKDEQIEQYKSFKLKLSTKMIGESLEQHCSYEFNRNRMAMFPKAYFEKDNDASSGSKGDFIFRDYEDGIEYISIMFEMKNEADTTATKHKNEDFFKELDKDRREKNCEYAILVSMLEQDNELYNEGIVDVSYRYPKMYVIRPQFFIPIITLLRNAALNSVGYQKQLMIERNNNLDITNFEENMNTFKTAFAKNYELASRRFNEAIEEIDKTISHLQKTKDALLSSENNLRLANNKAQDLSIKKLTKNAPSVAQQFAEIKKG